jgi:lysozyme family protein
MNANFARALAAVLQHEGGYVDHPKDPGGPTNKGVTLATYRKLVEPNGTAEDLKRITDAQVASIYRSAYWDVIRGDDLPAGLDYAVFDYAVNSGPARAAKSLQGVLGVAADGIIGPVTLAAAQAANPIATINALCDRRLAFLKSLSTWATFGKGWQRRVDDVREDAIQLTAAPPSIPAPIPRPIEQHEEPIAPPPDKRGLNWWVIAGILVAAALAGIAFIPLPI